MLKVYDQSSLSTHAQSLLHTLMYRDLYTQKHSTRVICLSEELGRACKLSSKEINILKTGACLHDLGKVGIPDDVLLKPSSLDHEEWQVMKTHSEIGEDIIIDLPIDNVTEIAQTVRHHHEHYAGSGYPDGLVGAAIPIYSRIITIADNYDAIAVARPYHKNRNHRQTMDVLSKDSDVKFDPEIFRIFKTVIENSDYKVA